MSTNVWLETIYGVSMPRNTLLDIKRNKLPTDATTGIKLWNIMLDKPDAKDYIIISIYKKCSEKVNLQGKKQISSCLGLEWEKGLS